jgi:hypothetical protein
VGDRTYSFTEDEGIALIDVQKTFFPYRSYWNWATCGARDEEGRIIALNLSQGININEEEYNDGCLWVDGRMSILGPARFTLDEKAVLEPWHVETTNRSCLLDFDPEGERRGKVNALLVMSDFHQPYGTFRGTALDSDGRIHEIGDYFGVVEHHLARY